MNPEALREGTRLFAYENIIPYIINFRLDGVDFGLNFYYIRTIPTYE